MLVDSNVVQSWKSNTNDYWSLELTS